jgi:general secretion pathway protein D
MEIAQRLNTPVDAKYQNRPLREVLDGLAKRASVPLYIDPNGLQSEGVSSDAKVTIDLSQDISLKSALNLILEQFHLTYVIKDEVLKITSEDARKGEVYQQIYPVGDLVIPIPNFAPSGREGINGAFREAYERMGFSGAAGGAGLNGAGPITLATNEQGAGSSFAANAGVLAQMQQRPGIPIFGSGSTSTGAQQNIPFGPGGLKGGQQADFDSLIDLITSTIEQESWTDKGGQGSIEPFNTNLSLVISQTQEVHEKIADLLQQLRRLQDLQVTIEVRFITLEDDFFEKMGIDFDFNIPTATTVPNPPPVAGPPPSYGPLSPSAVIGLDPAGNPTPLQDIQFRQGGFGAVTPPFGGFDAGSAATFGFAVLSDIQAFFVIQAAQGDTRSNILQAPKVTLFNGQQASIADQTQVPFVTSVVPVVGDFAAALQPVIVVLSQGTSLTVQAVVSNDRRFVRLTVVPFFSQIGDVNTFTFNGSSSTTKKSSDSKSGSSGDTSTSKDDESSSNGTTVQLPQFSFVTVTTTVSVPDGGTVLLGGIKRLNEGRTERGVPILSKLPYINRLFRNTAIGRETTSLMMMVTPRIIIQEEEEENLLGGPPQP